ncbi:MAG: GPR endopeptidase [Clostridia bacterium]|nr:GPR endopeptidase [Clostridia bacterium]MDE7215584.1 GPR endopeptidase [Clostridia bacterium]MDE7336515.1 GPR endopeptidase [Clostridia bacterium]
MNDKLYNFSDLLIEAGEELSVPSHSYRQKGVDIRETKVDKVLSRQCGKKEGLYLTLTPNAHTLPSTLCDVLQNCIKKLIRECGVTDGRILVVGLGNENVVVDALGNEVVKRIRTGGKAFNMSAIAPKVADITGIKSFDIVKAIVDHHKPSLVIAIDTLATGYLHRLGNCYQLTTAGICPGGGVNNPQPCLNRNTLSVPVVAIGVPLIISVGSILGNADSEYARYTLTPRDVDSLVRNCAEVIASALNAVSL